MRLIDADALLGEAEYIFDERTEELVPVVTNEQILGAPTIETEPVPDTRKPEKTADEMFRELGYVAAVTQTNEIWYRKKTEDSIITLIIDFDTKLVDCRIGRNTYAMEFGEILACAALIREMEKEVDDD